MRRFFNMLLGWLLGFAISIAIIALSKVWGWPAFLLFIPVVLFVIGLYIWADRREKYWRQKAWEAEREERVRGEYR